MNMREIRAQWEKRWNFKMEFANTRNITSLFFCSKSMHPEIGSISEIELTPRVKVGRAFVQKFSLYIPCTVRKICRFMHNFGVHKKTMLNNSVGQFL